MTLSKKDILAINDEKIVTVPVPEWGGDVCIRTLSGEARQEYSDKSNKLKSDLDKESFVIVTFVCDEEGKQLFDADDIGALNKKNSAVLDRLVREAFRINGIGSDAIEDAEKN